MPISATRTTNDGHALVEIIVPAGQDPLPVEFPATQAVEIQSSGSPVSVGNPLPVAVTNTVDVAMSGTSDVSVVSSVLPTGAATESTLNGLSAKFNSLGQKIMANSAPVVIAGDQTEIPVGIRVGGAAVNGSNPVPISDAASSISVDDFGGSLTVNDGGSSISVDDNGSSLSIDDNGGSLTIDAVSLPLPTGAATESTLSALNGKFGSIGQQAVASSVSVVQASSHAFNVSGGAPIADASTGVYTRYPAHGNVPLAVTGTANLKASAGRVRSLHIRYTGASASVYVQLHNAASTGAIASSTLSVPGWEVGSGNRGLTISLDHDIPCTNGISIAASSTSETYTAAGSETFSITVFGA